MKNTILALLEIKDADGNAPWEAHHVYSQNDAIQPWVEKMSKAKTNVHAPENILLAPKHIHTEITREQRLFWSEIGQKLGLSPSESQNYKEVFKAIQNEPSARQKEYFQAFDKFAGAQKSKWKAFTVSVASTAKDVGDATYNAVNTPPTFLESKRLTAFAKNQKSFVGRVSQYVDMLPYEPETIPMNNLNGSWSKWGKWANRTVLALGLISTLGASSAIASPTDVQKDAFDGLLLEYRNGLKQKFGDRGEISGEQLRRIADAADKYFEAIGADEKMRMAFYEIALLEASRN